MATVLIPHLDRQSRTAPVGPQRVHLHSNVRDSRDACLSRPPPSPTSPFHRLYPTHPHPTPAESVDRPRHNTPNGRLLLLSKYATLRSPLSNHNHLTPSSLKLSSHHYVEAPSSSILIHLPLRRPPRTSIHSPMANFYLSSIVPRRFRSLSQPAQQTD